MIVKQQVNEFTDTYVTACKMMQYTFISRFGAVVKYQHFFLSSGYQPVLLRYLSFHVFVP